MVTFADGSRSGPGSILLTQTEFPSGFKTVVLVARIFDLTGEGRSGVDQLKSAVLHDRQRTTVDELANGRIGRPFTAQYARDHLSAD